MKPGRADEWPEYQTYIRSTAWLKRRSAFRRTKTHCGICSVPKHGDMQVHHVTYVRMGAEQDADLMLVCSKCHVAIHELQRLEGISVASATAFCATRAVVHGKHSVSRKQIRRRNRRSIAEMRAECETKRNERTSKIESRKQWLREHTT